jgi:hypothetical protein
VTVYPGTFTRPPADATPEERRASCKSVADTLRERAGLPPTDARGKVRCVTVSTEEALLWLNDLIGQSVDALFVGADQTVVARLRGELQHWTVDEADEDLADEDVPDSAGRYSVGNAELDLTHLSSLGEAKKGSDFLSVALADSVELLITRTPTGVEPS